MRVNADVRRELFLVFKEAVNNVVRHSGCANAEVALQVDGRRITLSVGDDGCGFDEPGGDHGQGLASMRKRAEKLGGTLLVRSRAGAGTTLILRAPLRMVRAKHPDL
jgi:signal transduction histidine kinase